MAFDGIVTAAIAGELNEVLTMGKVEKIHQPEAEELVFLIHTKNGNKRLYMSCSSNHSCIHLTDSTFENPAQPTALCMLLRKHLHGGRIAGIRQVGSERIIEIEFETQNDLGFSVNKKLIVEIMGKHSNVTLVDSQSGKIIDCLRRVSIDVNRVRQLLPGKIYEYPPRQDKIPFWDVTREELENIRNASAPEPDALSKAYLNAVGGISPAISRELGNAADAYARLECIREAGFPAVYLDENGVPKDFHAARLEELAGACEAKTFDSISKAVEYYFYSKAASNKVAQKSNDLARAVKGVLAKLYLKKQRLSEDLVAAKNSDDYRLYGELLNANIHLIKPGSKSVKLVNYYDGSEIVVPLDERYSGAKNAQLYFKKYGKAKTAIHEKKAQLTETDMDIAYLESVLTFAENAAAAEETEALREELVQGGYLKKRRNAYAAKRGKSKPLEYKTASGYRVLVGRNIIVNDQLNFKMAGSKDIWMHTKDIHGSHVILFAEGKSAEELGADTIYEAASIAAYYSQGRSGENIPVDYVPVKLVKKPAGSRPGMVIFTGNRTVYVNPKLPTEKNCDK